MKIKEIIKQPEGRRLEFKEILPTSSDIAKTVIAFSNDAGGELFIGIKDKPRELTGLPEGELFQIEEQISNIIYERCYPVIIPEISFHSFDDKHFIRVQIHRGNSPPYYLKDKGKLKGSLIRVGSTNRLADEDIIKELERQKRNISFDSELIHEKIIADLDLKSFADFFLEKTGEKLNDIALKKLELYKTYQGTKLPTIGCVLLSDDALRNELFHYAKIECARFKGTTIDEFIDQKTIYTNIAIQAEAAYEFVLRHINKGATVTGVYTKYRWEYPVKAIREAIRNAVVHRDYSLTGKDIKVAIYDDMVEITSPGKLLPSINFNELESRQSDIRNKVIAPVFKKLGIIDQWGNGLKLISDELVDYPDIEFKWIEVGMQFQVQFIKKDYTKQQDVNAEFVEELNVIGHYIGTKLGLSWDQAGTKLAPSWHQVNKILEFCDNPQSIQDIMKLVQWKNRTKFRNKFIKHFLEKGLLSMTIQDKPNSPKQQYYLTENGKLFLQLIRN